MVMALPDKLEVWFLSQKAHGFIEKYRERIVYSKLLAQGGDCIPMGDGCFNPQIGFIEDESKKPKAQEPEGIEGTRTFNMDEVDLLECDKNYYFDMFCGQAKKKVAKKKRNAIEVWIDISGSFRLLDYSSNPSTCRRRKFVEHLKNQCPNKIDFKTFHTDLMDLNSDSYSCLSNGGNNQKKLLQWIEDSDAKKLIIITDISEYSKELDQLLARAGARVRGIDAVSIYTDDLIKLSSDLVKSCKN